MTQLKVVYTAEATAIGDGRNGEVHSSDGVIDEKLSIPTEMGGPGGLHTNPEQLFASGYAACFHSALRVVAGREHIKLGEDTEINAKVSIGPNENGGFELSVVLDAKLPGVDKAKADDLIAKAHQVCPYSNATRGNIEVALNTTV
ncbi:MAG TPA: organic hydroperoxide resistance protein [Pseudonocardiaceae bacterium]|jgi:Ohr subfamily peroxiredoxin